MLASAMTWSLVLSRWQRGLPAIPPVGTPRGPWPRAAVLTAAAWIALLAANRVVHELAGPLVDFGELDVPRENHPDASRRSSLPNVTQVATQLVVSSVVWLVLLTAV